MNDVLIWAIVLILSIVVEVLTVSLVSIWFVVGSLGAMICAMLGLSSIIQTIVFIVVSLIVVTISRPIAKKALHGNITKTNTDQLIGKHALVTKEINPDNAGEVKVMGQLWRATSLHNELVKVNEYGEIIAIEGAHVIIRKLGE